MNINGSLQGRIGKEAAMKFVLCEQEKILEIWLNTDEQEETHVQQQIKELSSFYKKKKFLVVVYKSGTGDLLTNTAALLKSNLAKL